MGEIPNPSDILNPMATQSADEEKYMVLISEINKKEARATSYKTTNSSPTLTYLYERGRCIL